MTDIDGATTPGAAGAARDGEDSGAASDGRHRPADTPPSPAQAAAAKAALAKSGYDGTPIEISFPSDLTQNGVSFTDMSTRISADLNKIGIKTNLKGAPVATVLELARGGKQQVGVWLWGPDFPDSSNYLAFGPGGIVGGKRVNWKAGSNPPLESIMKQAATEKDEAKRAALAADLSHGDKRKVEIAMLLAVDPTVILLDEPMAGVGSGDVPALMEIIRRMHKVAGRTVMMVEHHMDVVLGLADRVAVMHNGSLLAIDTPDDIIANPAVQSAYLGETV